MSRLEDSKDIEKIVGAKRHGIDHIGRAVSAEKRIYVLHSKECVSTGIDVRECLYSVASDLGLDLELWEDQQDAPVRLEICPDEGDLLPRLNPSVTLDVDHRGESN